MGACLGPTKMCSPLGYFTLPPATRLSTNESGTGRARARTSRETERKGKRLDRRGEWAAVSPQYKG